LLRDALIRGGGAANGCREVWDAKSKSAYILHKLTLTDPIRVFICFSSIVAVLGNVGQSAYGAANSFLDELMSQRAANGLPGKSIRWPAVAGVGMGASLVVSEDTRGDFFSFPLTPSQVDQVYEKYCCHRSFQHQIV